MAKKSFNQEEYKPFSLSKDLEAAKKLQKSDTENLVSSLRTDILPASDAIPASRNILQRLNLKLIGGIFIGLVILGVIWFSLAGPGRPILEQNLAGLVKLKLTATMTMTPTPLPATKTSLPPSRTPSPTKTLYPTNTSTKINAPSATQIPAMPTLTPTPACRDVLTITLADVGQTLCVQGKVIEIIDKPNNFMLVFSNKPGAFYWVSYDMAWSQAELDTCYQIRGKIRQIANSPILIFDYSNTPQVCP